MGIKPKKRSLQSTNVSSKKRKIESSGKSSGHPKKQSKGKERAFEKPFIPIPNANDPDSDDSILSNEDAALLEEFGESARFLNVLDHKGISRSKKEEERIRQMNKPIRKPANIDDLPSIDSHDEESDSWNSEVSDMDDVPLSDEDFGSDEVDFSDSDDEMPYEKAPRTQRSAKEQPHTAHIKGLPVKLADGRVQDTGKRTTAASNNEAEDKSDSAHSESEPEVSNAVEDVATGARFGRPAVVDVLTQKSRSARIQAAKEQIAGLCSDILADPENSLGLLRRLHTFALSEVVSPSRSKPVPNDFIIRKLAILSQLAVFKDLVPGYRIRALTDKEKAEKVSQMVARTREWEQGLVTVYQSYLKLLETELKAKNDLSEVALRCMCTLAEQVTHFNFRVNLLKSIISQLSKKSWNASSDLCLNTLISIFRDDLTGTPSLEIVQLLNRMITERGYNVHPEVLTCLLHLRLKTELSVRASDSKVDKAEGGETRAKKPKPGSRGKKAGIENGYLSKKAKKALREKKEISRELREAEAEVDREERATTQTETLKLLFVLYFRILKNPRPTRLLPSALRGIAKFAHLINVDFFRDLLQVLRGLIERDSSDDDESGAPGTDLVNSIQHRLLCIMTAFELLSGQGEALNLDLSEFVNHLYAIIPAVSLLPDIDVAPSSSFESTFHVARPMSIADMLFRALNVVFSPKMSGKSVLVWRSAAFAKRLLTASLNWPPSVSLKTLQFIEQLLGKDPQLDALLSTEDRPADGIYRPDIDDPQLCNPLSATFWELFLLQSNHYDTRVSEAASALLHYSRV
ncbi:nucleolar complex-associated protein 3 [Coniophora puteana RWD-64-598 SS2]|uniref:Nucleolar complex-associated protein 3 n=1 Tax=Coniophora puteana (strain RWD-64-598) TaxID=741705 RepID=A0A5M3N1S3_CONPW|nr:nucleolar complex-associated protein 3 [Coniophora puteana RWD-64-598 SS2]EIW85217.1 nucleolar complex-associated protein 3 [Coniophora puteana RWD-64-598 SS2]